MWLCQNIFCFCSVVVHNHAWEAELKSHNNAVIHMLAVLGSPSLSLLCLAVISPWVREASTPHNLFTKLPLLSLSCTGVLDCVLDLVAPTQTIAGIISANCGVVSAAKFVSFLCNSYLALTPSGILVFQSKTAQHRLPSPSTKALIVSRKDRGRINLTEWAFLHSLGDFGFTICCEDNQRSFLPSPLPHREFKVWEIVRQQVHALIICHTVKDINHGWENNAAPVSEQNRKQWFSHTLICGSRKPRLASLGAARQLHRSD